MPYDSLPHVNAILNGTSALLLLTGYYYIRRANRTSHRNAMIAAFTISCLFLVSYLVYHAEAGSVRFQRQGWIRPVYFTILTSHTILAAAVVPMILVTLARAAKKKYERHRRMAAWTFPTWLYVSVTGVVIYLMLYRL